MALIIKAPLKNGDRVILQRSEMFHRKGETGTVTKVLSFHIVTTEYEIDVVFDNCDLTHEYLPYCNKFLIDDSFPEGFWLKKMDKEDNPPECECSSYNLTWIGHDMFCPVKKGK
jgi:hypothetical protein